MKKIAAVAPLGAALLIAPNAIAQTVADSQVPDAFMRMGPIVLIVLGLVILVAVGWAELRKRKRSHLSPPPSNPYQARPR